MLSADKIFTMIPVPVGSLKRFTATKLLEAKRSLSNLYWRPVTRLKDAVPVPPRSLLVHVMAQNNVKLFLKSGRSIRLQMNQALTKYLGTSFRDYHDILDFGVGCGRIERWLDSEVQGRLTGVDVSAALIDFCRNNLPGEYAVIRPEPDLPFEAGRFDLVVSFSVFSHMDRDDAAAWIDELYRITADDAVLLVTTHMEWCADNLLADNKLREYYDNGTCVVDYGAEGDHHEKYVSTFYTRPAWEILWGGRFELVGLGYGRDADEFAREGHPVADRADLPMGQALSVFRKC